MVDNASTDDTLEILDKEFPQVKVIRSQKNLGFGKANNIGIKYALEQGADYVYLLNQDAWLLPDTLQQLVSFAKEHPEYGIISPLQMQANLEHFDDAFLNGSLRSNMQFAEDLMMNRESDIFPLQTVMAAHWLVSRACIEKVGLFSPSFPHYGEDDNYTNRVRYWNMKVGVAKDVMAVHNREFRVSTPEKSVYMSYISVLKEISSIADKKRHPLMASMLLMFRSLVKYGRIRQHASLWLRLCHDYKTVMHNRQLSLKEGAFL